ncbi:MAG: FTR1 family protein [Reyranella sp.]|uniref:FTR1 family protein n=1 Tax=Reyranella sp. TaxID=1929291 RepID=UPI003D0AE04F
MHVVIRWLAVGLILGGFAAAARAQPDSQAAAVAWRLLDYLGVDYEEAVADNGRIVSQSEYDEMVEFSRQVRDRLAALPATPAQPSLISRAAALQAAIARKAPPAEVAGLAKSLKDDLLAAYPVPLAPARAPDPARGAALYAEHCASCHGAMGAGDGPAAKGMEPPPVAFTDIARARARSVFGLYQVIDQGLEGTAMTSFAHLPADDRWALAFHVGTLASSSADADRGKQLWQAEPGLRARLPNLQALTQTTPAELAQGMDDDKALAVMAWLRRHPEALVSGASQSLALARQKLADSVAAYAAGDRKKATDLALSAYLDGFEPLEPSLKARDNALMGRIETAMIDFRAAIAKGESSEALGERAARVAVLFDTAERVLAPEQADIGTTFAAAFTILLREGLEALLVVVAMLAFLHKAGRSDVVRYVHAGWVAALIAGGLTWVAATWFVSISGASRELTEGFGSLLAAVILVSVGLWMHGKAQADAWQRYVREKLSRALSARSAWFLLLLAFVVVYREVFETILFFIALWSDGGSLAMIAGAAAGAAALALVASALLRYSRRLPVTRFFALSSILIAVLAVILAGKGVAALQEAGLVDSLPMPSIPRVEVLGLYPTREGVLVQLATAAILILGFWRTARAAAVHR